jgi:serine/threonine protein kinase
MGTGIFGVTGRSNKKIIAKQQSILKNLKGVIRKHDGCGLDKNEVLLDLLARMLEPHPLMRISPIEALSHQLFSTKF